MIALLQSGRLTTAALVALVAMPIISGIGQAATSPFGVGLPEQNTTAGLLPWIAALQKATVKKKQVTWRARLALPRSNSPTSLIRASAIMYSISTGS